MKTTDRTGKVAGAIAVLEDDDVMLMTSGGKTVRIKASGISSIGRNAQGVKLVTLSEGEIIKDIVRVVGEDPEAEDSEDAEAEAPEALGGEEATTPDTAGPSDDSADES